MRIKKYDYDTCVKLKNPLREYDEVKKWIETDGNFEKMTPYFSHDNHSYRINEFHVDITDSCILIKHISDFFYSYTIVGGIVRILKKDNFTILRELFLKYKLSEKLSSDLPINNKKEKRMKI